MTFLWMGSDLSTKEAGDNRQNGGHDAGVTRENRQVPATDALPMDALVLALHIPRPCMNDYHIDTQTPWVRKRKIRFHNLRDITNIYIRT